MERDALMKKSLTGTAYRLIWALEKGENYCSELARITNMTPMAAHKTLKRLSEEGVVVKSKTIGRIIFYKLK